MVRIRTRQAIIAYLTAAPFVLFALFPFAWMLITSLKQNRELYDLSQNPFLVHGGITWDHYRFLFEHTAFPLWLRNSTFVALVTTVVSVLFALLAAYALARLRFAGAESIATFVFIVYLVPTTLLFLPLARLVAMLRLSNTLWALVVTYPAFIVPFATWMLMAYFSSIPRDLEESALVDGCTRLRALWHIVLPLARPGIVTAALFAFTLAWGEFMYALTFISTTNLKTVTAGVVVNLIRGDVFYWGSLMGGALLASLPVVLVFSLFLDSYVSGLTAGAVKG
ncbi:MAG TPA: carbohydrate ABC transporter permease [archaeon]|nr:carbohydrate ABC transporter permease [archaeon]